MARPLKKGLDYFALDVSFYRDIKIRKLIRRKGGDALGVYIVLLCMIYEDGYYIAYDEDLPFVISEITTFSEEHIDEVIKYCVDIELFDKELFVNNSILTSRGLQKRYITACTLTKRKIGNNLPYMLIDTNNKGKDVTSEENSINTEETEVSTDKTQINSVLSTQRKEKKNIDNNSLRSSLSSTTTSTSRVRDFEDTSADNSVDVKNVIEELKSNRDWLLSMQRRHGIEKKQIVGWLNAFVVECDCRGSRMHEDKSDVMRHFNDWLMIQIKPKRGDKGKTAGHTPSPPNYQEIWVRAKAELCASVTAEQSAFTFDLMEYADFNAAKNTLNVTIPDEEVFHRLESQPYIDFLRVTLRKYFNQKIRLEYQFLNVSKS